MTRSKSKYDELHDRFFTILSTKAGTRYERLAALVFKRLHEQHAVIHDFKLIGASKVKHQIDVLLEIDGKSRRVLVECKDFDKAGKPVGLGIIRNFWAVIEDTHADEAFVVTCTRYTPPARRYATAKGIKLAVLRVLEDANWEGYIRSVKIQMHVESGPRIERSELALDRAEHDRFVADLRTAGIVLRIDGQGVMFRDIDPIFLVSKSEKLQVMHFLRREIESEVARQRHNAVTIDVDPQKWRLHCNNGSLIRFTKLTVQTAAPRLHTMEFEVAFDRIAELILKGLATKM